MIKGVNPGKTIYLTSTTPGHIADKLHASHKEFLQNLGKGKMYGCLHNKGIR